MTDYILPRHRLIINFLRSKAPKRYSSEEIAKAVGLSYRTVANEMPTLMQLEPEICRSVRAKAYKYYVGTPESLSSIVKAVDPLTSQELLELVERFASPDYIPGPAKMAWQVPLVLSIIYGNPYELPATLEQARQAIEDMADGYEANARKFRQLLITPQTKEVEELARQLKENSDRLRTSYSEQERPND